MKSFLLKDKTPIVKWGMIPDETYYQGSIPHGYQLAVVPSKGTVIIDVDRHGDSDGFEHIPKNILKELCRTFTYDTKNEGAHYWIKYTGEQNLANKPSGLGIDLRTHKGYVVYYPANKVTYNLQQDMKLVQESSETLNKWLEKLFGYKYV